jgi:hypothetical protein
MQRWGVSFFIIVYKQQTLSIGKPKWYHTCPWYMWLKNIKLHILFSWQKKKNSYIYFITMICATFSIKTSFSRTNTFEIHSISTSKSLIHLIIDDIKNYCIFGTIVPKLNVKPNWEKVNYLSFNSFIHPFLACYLC